MPYTRRWSVALAAVLAVSVYNSAAPLHGQPAPVDVDRVGPQVGETVPDFVGTDQQGRARTVQSLMGREGLMLVFNRSADW